MGFGRVNLEWVKEDKSIFFLKELVVQDEQTNRRNEKWIHIFEGKKEHQGGKLLRKERQTQIQKERKQTNSESLHTWDTERQTERNTNKRAA